MNEYILTFIDDNHRIRQKTVKEPTIDSAVIHASEHALGECVGIERVFEVGDGAPRLQTQAKLS